MGKSSAHPSRPIWKKLLFGLIPACLLLLAAEVTLRIVGFSSGLADPYESFVLHTPLFEQHGATLRTRPTGVEFFHDQQFDLAKPEDVTRFFVFGGSTTFGCGLADRWNDNYGSLLTRMLASERRFEVVNCGGICYASYRLVGLVEECLAYSPDFVIVMTGNNEFLEARHYGGLKDRQFSQRAWYSLRIAQLLLELASPARPSATVQSTPSGIDDWALKADRVEEKYVVRDENEFRQTLEHFKWNLSRIAEVCRQNGVPLILCTVPSNLRDFFPYATEPQAGTSLKEMNQQLATIKSLHANGQIEEALLVAREVLSANPRAAAFHFLVARCLDDLGRPEEALASYLLAKDLDLFPHRALSTFNQCVRELAVPLGAYLLDAEKLFAAASPDGIPGKNLFSDNCHPTREGHQLLAKHLALLIRSEILPKLPGPSAK